jgi:hypothetical protein
MILNSSRSKAQPTLSTQLLFVLSVDFEGFFSRNPLEALFLYNNRQVIMRFVSKNRYCIYTVYSYNRNLSSASHQLSMLIGCAATTVHSNEPVFSESLEDGRTAQKSYDPYFLSPASFNSVLPVTPI